jgi:tetratricopeptide (TPR) repeat protein
VGNRQGALKHMKLASEIHPEYLLMVAGIYRADGNAPAHKAALEEAAIVFKDRLLADEKSSEVRTIYSKILFELEQFEEAERVLLEGQKLTSQGNFGTECADLYLSQFLRTKKESDFRDHSNLNEKFELLGKSLSQDINHLPTYEELLQAYRDSGTTEERNFVEKILQDNVADNESVALAHLSLSSILWIQGKLEESKTHMETAFRLDSEFSFVVNNLAWVLAHGDPPDLDRAFELAEQVVELNPRDGRFRDTLATILMKQKRYSQALTEFQKAISTADDKKSIHRKMAQIYRSLNKPELASQHQSKADAN